MNLYQVIKKPLITEKAVQAKEVGQYSFEVAKQATKTDVKRAVEELFRVKVDCVRTLNVKGEVRPRGKRMGKTPDWKKALVILRKGEKIELFEGV